MIKNLTLLLYIVSIIYSCNTGKSALKISLENTSDILLEDYPVYLDIDKIKEKNPELSNISLIGYIGKTVVPVQKIERMGKNYFLVVVTIKAKETLDLVLRPLNTDTEKTWKKRTHAELAMKKGGKWVNSVYEGGEGFTFIDSLRVPDELTDHSYFLKYEGPGWESDKVGYRFYLDWRNAVDIFGKITADIALPDVGIDGYDSYHDISDWGMDILKVGNSLGIGSIATWNGEKAERVEKTDSVICTVEADGDLYSAIRTRYYNWQTVNGIVNLDSWLSITAGSRMTEQILYIDSNIKNIATGIVKQNNLNLMKGPAETNWSYIATWGNQSLNNDDLGIVVFFKNEDVVEITEDELSYVVVLKPSDQNKIKYYYAAVWEKENGNTISENDFINYINNSLIYFEKPVEINW